MQIVWRYLKNFITKLPDLMTSIIDKGRDFTHSLADTMMKEFSKCNQDYMSQIKKGQDQQTILLSNFCEQQQTLIHTQNLCTQRIVSEAVNALPNQINQIVCYSINLNITNCYY